MDTLISEIDTLRKKLELLISVTKTDLMSENAVMECSQELDDLITRYYRQIFNTAASRTIWYRKHQRINATHPKRLCLYFCSKIQIER